MECQTEAIHDGGDHSIIVGRVTGVGGPRDPAGPEDPASPAASGPLVHYSGAYRRLETLDPANP